VFDLLRFAKAHQVPYAESGHHHCKAGWVQIHCPQCTGGRFGFHLGFQLEKGNFNCWRCGPIKVWDVVGMLLHTTRRDLVQKAITEFRKAGQTDVRKFTTRPYTVPVPPGTGPMAGIHKRYLTGRGFDPGKLAEEWGLKGTRFLSGAWNWRVIIPIHNEDGVIVAYQGRSVSDTVRPKYRFTDNKDCAEDPLEIIYGLDRVRDSVVIVEGVTGVWRLGEGAVATFGIDWKRHQANRLRKIKRRFILFDPEPKAQQRAEALAKWMSVFPGETEVVSGFRTDPGDFSDRQAERIMRDLQVR
jgi:hypothetical protein